jgi:GNAT superfamily N-acetyltransferase
MLDLIKELAVYERAGDEVVITPQDLIRDGFTERPAFRAILAEQKDEIIGMALLYERYSTWKGRTLYLEDLIVTESARGRGIGEALLKECVSIAEKGDYKRLEWQVLDWNKPAIDFYRKMKVELDETWINCRMRF